MANEKFKAHPLVAKLTSAEADTGAVKLLGYFGSTTNGVVRIYPSLDDLSVCFSVHEADIVHVEDASAEELPHGGSAIWLKPGALVERVISQRTSVPASFLAGEIAAQMAGGPARSVAKITDEDEPQTWGAGGCTYGGAGCNGSVWPCSALIGACLKSNDMPCVNTKQWWCPKDVYTAHTCFTCAGFTCIANCYSAGCPPTRDKCPATNFQHTQCCEVFSAFCNK